MVVKKLINKAEDVVEELIKGLVSSHNDLCHIEGYGVVMRSDYQTFKTSGKVSLISGGGSGHEPSHAGFIGQGMLSAAVLGGVFASPSPQQVYQAIKHVSGPAGCLLIVKNYTGDRLNFGIAQELAIADGIPVELVIVADDVALVNQDIRRGLAGTIFVHKIAGALAESGASLKEIKEQAEAVIRSVGTMGVGLGPCTIPGAEKPGFELADNEIELGLGIHGEPGVSKQTLLPVDNLVDTLLEKLSSNITLTPDSSVAVMINGLGSTPLMELYIASRRTKSTLLNTYKVNASRIMVGNFMSALDMPGFSISLLPLDNGVPTSLLDAPTTASAWPGFAGDRTNPCSVKVDEPKEDPVPTLKEDSITYRAIKSICDMFIEKANYLTELDRAAGDGDMGISMERGARAVLKHLDTFPESIPLAIRSLARCIQQHTGGTSGVLYAIFFLKVAATISEDCNVEKWGKALQNGANGISELGGASIGDCTMLDALIPAVNAFAKESTLIDAFKSACEAAQKGSDSTLSLEPKMGRAQYLGSRATNHRDAGAEAVSLIFLTLQKLMIE